MVVTIETLKGGRGGGGGGSRGRGRGRGGNTFKKSGPDDPRIGSSVQIFVEGLPQVHTIVGNSLTLSGREVNIFSLKLRKKCTLGTTITMKIVKVYQNTKKYLEASKVPDFVQYFSIAFFEGS